jgi:hypothetical protein
VGFFLNSLTWINIKKWIISMSTFKNVSDQYTLTSPQIVLNGNVTINGSQTAIETTNSTLRDNTITLNDGETGAGVTLGTAGILINRGTLPSVAVGWNESVKAWQVILQDGTTTANILYSTGSGTSFISNVYGDTAPVLGGNLDVQNRQIYSSTGSYVTFNDNIAIATTTVAPSALSGNVVVYAQTPGGGSSGLYVNNNTYTQQELATQSAAIKYAIIFG